MARRRREQQEQREYRALRPAHIPGEAATEDGAAELGGTRGSQQGYSFRRLGRGGQVEGNGQRWPGGTGRPHGQQLQRCAEEQRLRAGGRAGREGREEERGVLRGNSCRRRRGGQALAGPHEWAVAPAATPGSLELGNSFRCPWSWSESGSNGQEGQ